MASSSSFSANVNNNNDDNRRPLTADKLVYDRQNLGVYVNGFFSPTPIFFDTENGRKAKEFFKSRPLLQPPPVYQLTAHNLHDILMDTSFEGQCTLTRSCILANPRMYPEITEDIMNQKQIPIGSLPLAHALSLLENNNTTYGNLLASEFFKSPTIPNLLDE
eukprot:2711719-Rhodomonas_salina.1